MDDGSHEIEISVLKEALCAQHEVLEKLQLELEIERDSAATAVSEALSMILRLQGEKAAEEMEARQYKRVTEEKLHHAERSLIFYEELMQWKEMQISSLELQLQACPHKFGSVGYYDFENGEIKSSGCSSSYMNVPLLNDFNLTGIGRRASLPLMKVKLSKFEFDSGEKEGFTRLMREQDTVTEAHCRNGFKPAENMLIMTEGIVMQDDNNCWQKMEQTDKQMESPDKLCKGICNCDSSGECLNATIGAHSTSAKARDNSSSLLKLDDDYQLRGFGNSSDSNAHGSLVVGNTATSMVIHDVYEILQDERDENVLFDGTKVFQNLGEVPQYDPMSCHTDEHQSIKDAVRNVWNEDKESSKWQFASTSSSTNHVDPKMGHPLWQSDYLKIGQRLQILEDEKNKMERQKYEGRQREIELLSEIADQLRLIQMKIPTLKTGKQSMPVGYIDYVIEAMLSFSI